MVIVLLPFAMQDVLKSTNYIGQNKTPRIYSWNNTFLRSIGSHYLTAGRSFAEDDILAITVVRNLNVKL
jgi:hypothetical protein